MFLEKLRRRRFLGGLSAVAASLAGCGSLDSADVADPGVTEARSDSSSPPENPGVPPHDHSTSSQGGASLRPEDVSITEFQQPASYVVYKRDEQVVALDAATSQEAFTDRDARTVIQAAIDALDAGGTVYLSSGTYHIGPESIEPKSGTRLVGEGIGATVLRVKDGLNRVADGFYVINIDTGVRHVTIANLEIDGNESNNRDVPPYPASPHSHGISIEPRVASPTQEQKPAYITVRNVYVHDTIRSNVVLTGRHCELANLWLANSATDHWLYMAGAEHCTVRRVHVGGFARAEGLVLGVGSRPCVGNTVTDVKVTRLAETPYQNDAPEGLGGRYPLRFVTFRPSAGNAFGNTLQNVDISIPDAPVGQSIAIVQANTRVQNVHYHGPMADGPIVSLDHRAVGSSLEGADLTITETRPDTTAAGVAVEASESTLEGVSIVDHGTEERTAVVLASMDAAMRAVTLRDVRTEVSGLSLLARGMDSSIESLYVANFHDLNSTGVRVDGDVRFLKREVFDPAVNR